MAITQPTFLPWSGYFDLIARADVFVLLDSVQFQRQSWHSRNRILTRSGDLCWVSVPVVKAPLDTCIADMRIAVDRAGWPEKHVKTVQQALAATKFRGEAESLLSVVYDTCHTSLAELNEAFIRAVSNALELNTRIVRSSQMTVSGKRTDLLLAICDELNATDYYANAGSARYLEAERHRFEQRSVGLHYQSWKHPVYSQFGRQEFVSHLSIIDALSHVGVTDMRRCFA